MQRREFLTAITAIGAASRRLTRAAPVWRAGVATIDITPDRSLWMAGFAARTEPSQGVALPLHAKALALQCRNQPTAVLVTTDLLGVTAGMTDRVAGLVQRRHGLRRANLLFNASHTHCGPVVDEQLSVAYGLTATQLADIRTYTRQLEDKLALVIGNAVASSSRRSCRTRAARQISLPTAARRSSRWGRSITRFTLFASTASRVD
jgi:hypothetical protein